jgi:starch synthase
MEGIDEEDLEIYKGGNYTDLMLGALRYADAIVYGDEDLSDDYIKMAENTRKPILNYQGEEDYINAYNTFYDFLIETIVL